MTPKFIHTRKELMGMTYLYIYTYIMYVTRTIIKESGKVHTPCFLYYYNFCLCKIYQISLCFMYPVFGKADAKV